MFILVRSIPRPPKFIAPGRPLGRALGGAVVGVFFVGSNEAPRTPTDGFVVGGVGSFGCFTSAGLGAVGGVGLLKNEFAMPIFISSNMLFDCVGGTVDFAACGGGAVGFGVDNNDDFDEFDAKICDDIFILGCVVGWFLVLGGGGG